MGIHHFYSWFRKQFPRDIYKIKNSLKEVEKLSSIDNLMIDMNGLFHTSTQKVYKYGSYKPHYDVLVKQNKHTQLEVYKDICNNIEEMLITMNPNKRLILCIDGSAPLSKMQQQKKRRFHSSMTREEDDKSFDSNTLTPGTKFMDHLSKYIDWFIRKRITENPLWQNIEVVFSSEKNCGEGEAKIFSYLRKYGKDNESYCLHGLDSDLIMLSLLVDIPKFYILRDDMFDKRNKYLLVDIESVKKQLIDILKWESVANEDTGLKFKCNDQHSINDFVFLCFLVGNDFLPHIPSLEIIEGGVEIIIDVCRNVGNTHGHITLNNKGNIYFSKTALKRFFEIISEMEQELLENKYKNRAKFFPDELLDSCCSYDGERYVIDIDKYRRDYCIKHFCKDDVDIEDYEKDLAQICGEYLAGMQWVLSYYTKQVPSWKWYYPYHYAPPASVIIKYLNTYTNPRFFKGEPFLPFQQLLYVLPPKSADILPSPLNEIIKTKLKKYYPEDLKFDFDGKRNDWQCIVPLPFVDHKIVNSLYLEKIDGVDKIESKRNMFTKSYIYRFSADKRIFYSYYGNIENCQVKTEIIEL